jgi:hypothetical protein
MSNNRRQVLFVLSVSCVLLLVASVAEVGAQGNVWINYFTVDQGDPAPSWASGQRPEGAPRFGRSAIESLGSSSSRATGPRYGERPARTRSVRDVPARADASSSTVSLSCSGGAVAWDPDDDIFVTLYMYVDGQLIGTTSAWGYSPTAYLQRDVAVMPEDQQAVCDASAVGETAEDTLTISGDPGLIPSGETTASGGWSSYYPTVHLWNQTLTGGSFNGRTVTEHNAGGGWDSCWFPGSIIDPFEWITGGDWSVDYNNSWGPDYVGWEPGAVNFYRGQARAPCGTEYLQQMVISVPGTTRTFSYITNLLRMGFTATTVSSERAGVSQSRVW